MAHFTSRAICLLLLAMAATALELEAEPKPVERVQKALKEVTDLSDNLRVETEKITLFNAGQKGIIISHGFPAIIVKMTEYTARIAGTAHGYKPTPFPDADAKLVVQSLTTFVKVHQALLSVAIRKHGLATMFPFFEPIRIALVNLEVVVDTFAFYVIDLIPTQKPAATDELEKLTKTFKDAEDTYSLSLVTSGMVTEDKPLVEIIQEALKKITDYSDDLREKTSEIEDSTYAAALGGDVYHGLFIVDFLMAEASAQLAPGGESLGKLSPLGDHDAKLVVQSLTTFADALRALLDELILKYRLLNRNTDLTKQFHSALIRLQGTVDIFTTRLINLIPTQKKNANNQIATLTDNLAEAEAVYSMPQYAEVAVARQMNVEAGKPKLHPAR